MSELLTIEDARSRILERARLLPTEMVAVADAAGRVLREPALARVDLPVRELCDGRFALSASETPGTLPVAYRIAAGEPAPGPLPPRTAAGIATGAAVPEGRRCRSRRAPGRSRRSRRDSRSSASWPACATSRRRRSGGDAAVAPGTRLGPAQIGALAAAGVADVRCSVRPRVAVLATGSELRPAGEPLVHGQIYESNRAMIGAVLRSAGANVELLPVVEDDESAHRAALERGLEADVLVSSGGVSMGPHDLVRRVAADLGVEEVFWGVAVKPGKPLSFGVRGATLVFGLPGTPFRRSSERSSSFDRPSSGARASRGSTSTTTTGERPPRSRRTLIATSSSEPGAASGRQTSFSSRSRARSRT